MARTATALFLASGLFVGAVTLSACQDGQAGDPLGATIAAREFLGALVNEQADTAWTRLNPATRREIYHDDASLFAEDVESADWSRITWEMGPVTDHDISWGVHARAPDGDVPEFLFTRGLAGRWEDDGLVILVQITGANTYHVAGQGLDAELGP